MKKNLILIALLGITLLFAYLIVAIFNDTETDNSIKKLTNDYPNCSVCHNGTYKNRLDKYTPKEIEEMMYQFKDDKYSTMGKIANNMTDTAIKAASKKFGKQ